MLYEVNLQLYRVYGAPDRAWESLHPTHVYIPIWNQGTYIHSFHAANDEIAAAVAASNAAAYDRAHQRWALVRMEAGDILKDYKHTLVSWGWDWQYYFWLKKLIPNLQDQ